MTESVHVQYRLDFLKIIFNLCLGKLMDVEFMSPDYDYSV